MNTKFTRLSLTALLVVVLSLTLAKTALANELHQTQVGSSSATFTEDCSGAPSLTPGQVYWHFVHTDTDGSNLPSTLTAIFQTAATLQADGYSNGDGHAQVMYDIVTDGDDILLGASDTITNDGLLNLSHVCHGAQLSKYDLTVTKTAAPAYTRTFTWTIDKEIQEADAIKTSSEATAHYTIVVTKDAGADSDWTVTGTITVANPNDFDVSGATLQDTTPGGVCTISGSPLDVPAGGTAQASYVCTFASNPGSGTNTVEATWPDFGSPHTSASYNKNYTFGDPTTLNNNSITVDDSDGQSWSFDKSGTVSYERKYNDPAGTCTAHTNSATIRGTGLSASASATVCVGADLQASKDATSSFKRTYNWDLSKAVDKTVVKQLGGSSASFNYTIKAWETGFSDSDWAVTGLIHVANPNDWEAVSFDAADALPGAGCSLTGGAGVTIVAGATVDLPYTCTFASQPDYNLDLTNTATLTWNKWDFYTPGASASGQAVFQFAAPTTSVNQTVTVADALNNDAPVTLGTLTAAQGQPFTAATFNYTKAIAVPAWNCSAYSNVAKIVETGQAASQTVRVCGPMKTGALTIGFWQNKNGQALIQSAGYSAPGGECKVSVSLRHYAPFQDLASPAANDCNLVAGYVFNVIKAANASGSSMNAMLKAQMLATALDVYFYNIGGYSVDLAMICTDLSCAAFENSSSVFGGSPLTISQMLANAAGNSNAAGSMWYGNVKSTQELAKDAFDAINNEKVFAP